MQQIFKQHADQQKKLIKELNDLQLAIDQKVLADLIHLSGWPNLPAPTIENRSEYFSEKLVAIKMVTAMVSRLITDRIKGPVPGVTVVSD